jgi:xanthine/uracil/vitamin C permease (AzgA family)
VELLNNFFKLKENGTDVKTELLAGLTTFLTMAYIIFVNPSILADAGMPKDALDIMGALSVGILNVVLVFFLVELFDATGTLMGVAKRAGLLVDGKMQRLNKALLADSCAIVAGSAMGTCSTTAYIESASGVRTGGRTGLTSRHAHAGQITVDRIEKHVHVSNVSVRRAA